MNDTVITLPSFDPVLVQIGPFGIRWYALAYIASLVLGWLLVRRLAQRPPAIATATQVDDFLTWATLGVVLGGRLGYVLFYQPLHFLAAPVEILYVWQGGMSFHGGALGVTIAIVLYCRSQRIPILGFADRIAIVTPMGLGLGRIANFVNGELWGRVAPPWWPYAMIFPTAPSREAPDGIPRFPSQLYESFLEGFVLFGVMWWLASSERRRARYGFLTGAFLAGYAVARSICEFSRQPDSFMGFVLTDLTGGVIDLTMGQVLCVPMFLAGVFLMVRARPHVAVAPKPHAEVAAKGAEHSA
jgi:phosphatidylglycerol:prolipoprotein diacylglycerol transferase